MAGGRPQGRDDVPDLAELVAAGVEDRSPRQTGDEDSGGTAHSEVTGAHQCAEAGDVRVPAKFEGHSQDKDPPMYLPSTSARTLGAALLIGAAVLTGCSDSGGDSANTPDAAASANGLEDVSADEILTEVISALDDASSVHITGELDNQGSPLTIDMTLSGEGSGSSSGNSHRQQ